MFIIILSLLLLCVGWYFHKARQAGVSLLIQIISAFVWGVFAGSFRVFARYVGGVAE